MVLDYERSSEADKWGGAALARPDNSSAERDRFFAEVNPIGKVPVIVHDGHVVPESAATCAYLAETFPAAGLAPIAEERADYYRWIFFAAEPVEQAVTNYRDGFVPAVKVMKRSDAAKFVVLPKHWNVERTIAWPNQCRRLAKDWERMNRNALAFLQWVSVRLMVRKLRQPKV